MNHIRHLLTILNPIHWSGRTLLVVGGAVYLVLTLLAIEPIAKMTVLKEFYRNVNVASQYSNELTFEHLVVRAQTSESDGRTHRRAMHFDNCSQSGTYRNNETNKTTYGAFICSKSFISLYWVDDFSAQTMSRAKTEMASLGWVDVGSGYELEDQVVEIQKQTDGTVRGFSFKRGENVNADILFLTRGSSDYESWCSALRSACRDFEKVDTTHQNIMVVEVSAFKYYDE